MSNRIVLSALLSSACAAPGATTSAAPSRAPTTTTRQGPGEGFVKVEGGRIWWQLVGTGDGLPVVVLHGGPGFPHDYLESLAALGDDRPVVFYDQLGCGRSDRPDDASLWRIDRFVAELETLRVSLGVSRMHLLGHSWGSMLAIEYLLAHPDRVASVVLDSPVASMTRFRADTTMLKDAMPPEIKATLDRHEAAGTFDSPEYQEATMAFYRRHVLRLDEWPPVVMKSLEGMGHAVYSAMWGPSEFNITGSLRDYEREASLGQLGVPTLFLVGRHDEVTPATAAAYQARTPGSELVVFEQGSHLKHLEEPEHYLRTVRDFLRRADAGQVGTR